jgi:hypothetical protein
VEWVYTPSVIALVPDNSFRIYLLISQHIAEAVGKVMFAKYVEGSISVSNEGTLPFPTSVLPIY